MTVNIVRDEPDIEALPRPVIALRATTPPDNWEFGQHSHSKAQLMFVVRGIIRCEVEEGIWIVPPQCALWIPSGLPHAAQGGSGETECYCLFVAPDAAPDLPQTCCTLAVSPLLRELLLRASALPDLYAQHGREGRLIAALLDELAAAPIEGLHLPMSRHPRIRQLTEMVLADPADKATLATWAQRLATSERSLTRLFMQEIGVSFRQWRRQLHVILALQRMSKGESVQNVAIDLGYESASGFVTMFRKTLGKPPASYLSERSQSAAGREGEHAFVLPQLLAR